MQPIELLEFRMLIIGFVGFLATILLLSNPNKKTDTNLLLFNLFLFGLLILLSI